MGILSAYQDVWIEHTKRVEIVGKDDHDEVDVWETLETGSPRDFATCCRCKVRLTQRLANELPDVQPDTGYGGYGVPLSR
jgi:hypothetical protein